jgi:glucokinase
MGNLENKLSGKALRERGVEAAGTNPDSLILSLADGNTHKITARTVFEAAQKGDKTAVSILEEAFSCFNLALCNVINMFDPEIVILGGGLSRSGEYLLQFITEQIKYKTLTNPEIKISAFKNNASVIGGIHYLIDHTDFLTEL